MDLFIFKLKSVDFLKILNVIQYKQETNCLLVFGVIPG